MFFSCNLKYSNSHSFFLSFFMGPRFFYFCLFTRGFGKKQTQLYMPKEKDGTPPPTSTFVGQVVHLDKIHYSVEYHSYRKTERGIGRPLSDQTQTCAVMD